MGETLLCVASSGRQLAFAVEEVHRRVRQCLADWPAAVLASRAVDAGP